MEIRVINEIGDNLKNITDTILRIEGVLSLSSDLVLGSNCILDFQGGSISSQSSSEVSIIGDNTEIRAPKYRIFNNVKLKGSFINDVICAEWFGVQSSTENNRIICSAQLQEALNNAGELTHPIPVLLGAGEYSVDTSILINKENQSLICKGCITLVSDNLDTPIIIIRNHFQKVVINELKHYVKHYSWNTMSGIGIQIDANVYNSTIHIDKLEGLKTGFYLAPHFDNSVTPNNTKYAGIQYCKISWQYCKCETGISIKIANHNISGGEEDDECIWVNENQFFGGRLLCKNGIIIDGVEGDTNLINGNVFNCIGIEGDNGFEVETPIKIFSTRLNVFRDLRLGGIKEVKILNSTTNQYEQATTYIDLTNCEHLNFSIKSLFPFNGVNAVNSRFITINAPITDKGKGSVWKGRNQIVIDKTDDSTLQYTTRQLSSRNAFKTIYCETSKSFNFNDLFLTNDGQNIMSNACKFSLWINSSDTAKTVTVDFAGSCYKMYPEMMIVFVGDNVSKLRFVNTETGSTVLIKELTKHGTYKVMHDEYDAIKIFPVAFFEDGEYSI